MVRCAVYTQIQLNIVFSSLHLQKQVTGYKTIKHSHHTDTQSWRAQAFGTAQTCQQLSGEALKSSQEAFNSYCLMADTAEVSQATESFP